MYIHFTFQIILHMMVVHNHCILLFEYEIFVEETEEGLVHLFPLENLDSLMSSGSYKDCNHMESSKLCCFQNWSSWWVRLLFYYDMTFIVQYNYSKLGRFLPLSDQIWRKSWCFLRWRKNKLAKLSPFLLK